MTNHTVNRLNRRGFPSRHDHTRAAHPAPAGQSGVALLTILLLVVVITVVAGAMLASQRVAIRQHGLLLNQNQLRHDMDAGVQLAMAVLRADQQLNDSDSHFDVWAQPLPPYVIGDKIVSVQIRDESAYFNINNLYQDGAVNETALAILQRLLGALGIDDGIAIAILDWQDPDAQVYQDGGSEAAVYARATQTDGNLGNAQPFNQAFVSVDQLAQIPAVTPEILTTLRPYLTAVPYHLPINLNTASPLLLTALVDGTDQQQLQPILNAREQNALNNSDPLWQLPAFAQLEEANKTALNKLIAVNSQAFMVLVTVSQPDSTAGNRQRFSTALISKLKPSPTHSPNASQTTPTPSHNPQQPSITAFNQRLWVFRPKLDMPQQDSTQSQ